MTEPAQYHSTRYEVRAYAANKEELRLTTPEHPTHFITADNVFAAVAALAAVPAEALMEWVDDEHEMLPVAQIVLLHVEKRTNTRGSVSYSMNTLETITR
ncbi:hypothetical protein [Streptomyces sp. NPDC054838]